MDELSGRYSWSDWPAAAARLRKARWTSSGTFLIWIDAMPAV
jgi:hypothetical protein